MEKSEYIEYVREYKIKINALVKFQRYLKRYLRKSTYPDPHYKLSEAEIREIVTKHLPSWAKTYGGTDAVQFLLPKAHAASQQWRVENLRNKLRYLNEERVYKKELFKESQKSEKVA